MRLYCFRILGGLLLSNKHSCFFDNNLNGTKKKFMEELAVALTDFVYLLIYLICVFAEGPHRSGPEPETSQNSRLPRWKTRLSMT